LLYESAVKICLRHQLRVCLVAILLGLSLAFANLSPATPTDRLLAPDQAIASSEDCSGSHGRGHGGDCRSACGTHCPVVSSDETAAPPPRARHFHRGAAQGIGDCIGRPEPHPPKSLFA
jgi:uncharacterized membrane protein